ncbi:MAG: hypothetical protein HUK25_00065 [Treponema sp.]|nr:hypothetical protein [Treponema sp.]
MKKIVGFVAGLLAAISLFSCYMGNSGDNSNTKEYASAVVDLSNLSSTEYNSESKVYLVQANLSNEIFSGAWLSNSSKEIEADTIPVENYFEESKSIVDIKPDFVEDAYLMASKLPKKTSSASSRALDSSDSDIDWTNVKVGDTVKFWITQEDYEQVLEETKCKAIGTHCRLFYFNDDEYPSNYVPSDTELSKLVTIFDRIFNAETNLLGDLQNNWLISDTDTKNIMQSAYISTKKEDLVNIVVYDIYNDVKTTEKTQFGIAGYFYPLDLNKNSYLTEKKVTTNKGKQMNSNEAEIFYVDSYFLNTIPEFIYSTLSHEFCHMLNYINKTLQYYAPWETWYTEMLAMNTEDLVSSYVYDSETEGLKTVYKHRIPSFLANPANGMIWKNGSGTTSDYGFTYTFGAYLVRNYGGVKLFHELATNPYSGETAINEAFKACNQKNQQGNYITWQDAVANFFQIQYQKQTGLTLDKGESYSLGGYQYSYDAIDFYKKATNDKGQTVDVYGWEGIAKSPEFEEIKKDDTLGKHSYFGPNIFSTKYYLKNIGPKASTMQIVCEGNSNKSFKFTRLNDALSKDSNGNSVNLKNKGLKTYIYIRNENGTDYFYGEVNFE